MKFNAYLIALLFPLLIVAQQKNDKAKLSDIISKSATFYEKQKCFELNIDYKVFSSYTSSNVTETYKSTLINNNKDYYYKLHTTEFVKVGNEVLKVDHKSKAIEYTGEIDLQDQDSYYNLKKYLDFFSQFEVATEGDFFKCTLSTPEISTLPYSKIVLYINKTNYQVSKQIFYFLVTSPYKDKKGIIKSDYPRMEVTQIDFKSGIGKFSDKLLLQNYVIKNKSKVSPSSKLMGYKVFDLTKN
ncbi:hypothetical protein FMM05_02610 [Flavobacterium zepuense]|uniref:Outer membrane lipoprotein-sorting protein n=1 Tax=Flavobacterium zepuense TaxID=2593302 RepID=A0A552VB11_9FLAO|nr:hypothetical protein [Flavobacterium zepuense]TRW27550.1 hypothetical protein FMM05_02610 [Flavobacterium zepuense]